MTARTGRPPPAPARDVAGEGRKGMPKAGSA
jgi:hypothetical protein